MTLLVSDAIAHIRHTLASEDVPSIGAHRILNDAGQFMVNMHNWKWLEGAQSTLSLTGGQDYVWLPEDFREIIAVEPTSGLNNGFRITTQDRLLELRSLAVTNSFEWNGAVVYAPRSSAATGSFTLTGVTSGSTATIADAYNPTVSFVFVAAIGSNDNTATTRYVEVGSSDTITAQQFAVAINNAPSLYVRAIAVGTTVQITHSRPGARGNGMLLGETGGRFTTNVDQTGIDGGPLRPRLDLWPTPVSDEVDRLMVYYRGGWATVDSDNALIPIPDWIETLYLTLVRAFARGYERESEASIEQRIMEVKAGPIYAAAQLRDKEMTASLGPIRGGSASGVRSTYDHLWNFSGVSAPN